MDQKRNKVSVVDKLIQELKKSKITLEERVALTNALLDKLGAFPIGEIVVVTGNELTINGKSLNQEQVLGFREACSALKDNFARKVLNEQLRYKATELGIHKATTVEELLFSKAILWFINEENILIETFLGTL